MVGPIEVHPERLGNGVRPVVGSAPAELVQPVVVDAEMVCHFVDHGGRDLFAGRGRVVCVGQDRLAVDGDGVGQVSGIAGRPGGQRHPVVQAVQVLGGMAVLDQNDDVVHRPGEFRRDQVESLRHQFLELGLGHHHRHVTILPGGTSEPGTPTSG